jgi:hypothetical protein
MQFAMYNESQYGDTHSSVVKALDDDAVTILGDVKDANDPHIEVLMRPVVAVLERSRCADDSRFIVINEDNDWTLEYYTPNNDGDWEEMVAPDKVPNGIRSHNIEVGCTIYYTKVITVTGTMTEDEAKAKALNVIAPTTDFTKEKGAVLKDIQYDLN